MVLWEELLDRLYNRPSKPVPAVAPQPNELAPLLNQRVQIAPENRAATLGFLPSPLRFLAAPL